MQLTIRRGASWDFALFLACLALVAVSSVAMVSATSTLNPKLTLRHIQWMVVGIALHIAVARGNYRRWIDAGIVLYAAGLAALLAVEITGAVRLGAARWLSFYGVSVQPTELAKLGIILWLARHLAGQPFPLPNRQLAVSLCIAVPPILLVLAQPDLGSSSILAAIWLGMVIVAGISGRLLGGLVLVMLLFSPLGWFALKEYQRSRVLVFLNPNIDPLGAGYTIIQSVIAIGSGQLWGRGFKSGTQNQLNFLPEHHSDFIFAVIGEEWGFMGCFVVVVLFGFLLSRILRIASESTDPQGRMVAAGVFCWIAYQAVVNIGMVMGILPVVGVPLPFISFGGTSMVSLWVALGLVQSVRRHGSV